jgi:hypothetical protein
MQDTPIQPDDDRTIPDAEGLWRRIHPSWIVPDRETGGWRVSSAAFIDRRGELSVDLASLTTVEWSLAGYPEHSLAEVKVAVIREKGYGVVRDPLPENAAHALVRGRMTKAYAREIARATLWKVLRPRDDEHS